MHSEYLYFEVKLHVSPGCVMRVFLQYTPEWRLPLVQVTVLQQVVLLGLRSGDQLVLLLVVSEGGEEAYTVDTVKKISVGLRLFNTGRS